MAKSFTFCLKYSQKIFHVLEKKSKKNNLKLAIIMILASLQLEVNFLTDLL